MMDRSAEETERATRVRGEALEGLHVHLGARSQDQPVDTGRSIGFPQWLVRDVVRVAAGMQIDGVQAVLHRAVFPASPRGVWMAARRSITVMTTVVSCSPSPA